MVALRASHAADFRSFPAMSCDTHFNIAVAEVDQAARSTWKVLGQGSYGQVLLANIQGSKVAVKCLKPSVNHTACDPDDSTTGRDLCLQHIWNEIMMLQCLQHPNIVSHVGAAHTQDNLYLVTEFCARGSVDRILHRPRQQPLPSDRILSIARQTVRAMVYMHKQAILHCDLKPANLLVTADWTVKVADFGNSRFLAQPGCLDQEATVEYCAPEVLAGGAFTKAADVWSFGVTLWEMLTQERPYHDCGLNRYMLIMLVASGGLTLPAIPAGSAHPILIQIVQACLDPCPEARPTFEEILETLSAASVMPAPMSVQQAPFSTATLATVHHPDIPLTPTLTQFQPASSPYLEIRKPQPLSSEFMFQTPRNAPSSTPSSPMSSPFAAARGATSQTSYMHMAETAPQNPFKAFPEATLVEPCMCSFSNDSNMISDVTHRSDVGMLSTESSVLSSRSTSMLVSSGPWGESNESGRDDLQNVHCADGLTEDMLVQLRQAVQGTGTRKYKKVDVYHDMAFEEVDDSFAGGSYCSTGWGVRDCVSGRAPVSCTCTPNVTQNHRRYAPHEAVPGWHSCQECPAAQRANTYEQNTSPHVFSTSTAVYSSSQVTRVSSSWFGASHGDTGVQKSDRGLFIDKG